MLLCRALISFGHNPNERQASGPQAALVSPSASNPQQLQMKDMKSPGQSPMGHQSLQSSPEGAPNKLASTPSSTGSNLVTMGNDSSLLGMSVGESKGADMDMPPGQKWFSGCVPLGLEDDKYWLSELQVYLRSNFAEAFGATEEDIAAPMHGRNKPIALGQVGIRCKHCKHENPAERGQQATSYPSLISGIYNSVQQMLRLHLDCCQAMPQEVRARIEQLKLSSSSRGGRKQYWIDSAKRLGLVDTPHGIHFGRDPTGPLPPLTGPSVNSKESRKKKESPRKDESVDDGGEVLIPIPQVDERPLVFPEDKSLISDYLYLTLEQMSPCVLMEADRVGCYKTRKVGFPGLACKHCVGQAGCGRYFPASEASLSQTTTSQTIMNHVRNCRRCPHEIRENLEIMKRARMGPDGKRADKPKHGGRKVFFHRLWCRIQGIPMEDGKGDTKDKKKRKPKASPSKKAPKKRAPSQEYDSEVEENEPTGAKSESSEEETETESSEDEENDNGGSGKTDSEDASKPKSKSSPPEKKKPCPWFEGCVRLTKPDDPHWLSESQCFARSDLVELFTLKEEESTAGYSGRKEPAVGQVGIRCVFCKSLDPDERRDGCLAFPESLNSIHTKVGDMLRLHFHSCPAMPDGTKESLKSVKGFAQKVADDTQQYWVDAARDIGLSDASPSEDGWGITFRRDPLQPSPCDDLDRENIGATSANLGKSCLIQTDDRSTCTDQVMLMMRQVKACTFQKRDRRVGQRNRDRAIGYPGLSCKHCATKNNVGRYFPVSAKNLTDNTANSLLTHVSSCNWCPEPIKASLAYLSHRSILQKAELSGSWKKAFFKKVWDRLHVERAWAAEGDEDEDLDEGGSHSGNESVGDDATDAPPAAAAAAAAASADGDGEDGNDNNGSGSETEEVGEQMNALIKAAAIWLTEQDQTTDGSSRTRAARGRALPSGSKRSTAAPRSRGGNPTSSSKRRRVHF